jgi:hypothetical protein
MVPIKRCPELEFVKQPILELISTNKGLQPKLIDAEYRKRFL